MISDRVYNSWSEVSMSYFDTNVEVEVEIFVSSVEMMMLSLDPDCLFVKGETVRSISFLGL